MLSQWGAPLRLALTLALVAVAPLLVLAIPRGETVAVVGAPWMAAEGMMAIVAKADGSAVRAGAHANVLIAHSALPDFVGRLYGAGAWLVMDARLGLGCSNSRSRGKK